MIQIKTSTVRGRIKIGIKIRTGGEFGNFIRVTIIIRSKLAVE